MKIACWIGIIIKGMLCDDFFGNLVKVYEKVVRFYAEQLYLELKRYNATFHKKKDSLDEE